MSADRTIECTEIAQWLDAYVDGELSARDSADFERALESCPGCRERLEAARKMSGLLGGMGLPPGLF